MTVRPAPDSLYGLTTLQTFLYFQKSWRSDSWRLKAFVSRAALMTRMQYLV